MVAVVRGGICAESRIDGIGTFLAEFKRDGAWIAV
jgi:hypothetical protein